MATTKEIKRRRNSIESTRQITRAMKLVATVKLQHTKDKAQSSVPYFQSMYKTVTNILAKSKNINHKYLNGNKTGKKALLIFSSSRGLCGGYNANIIKKLMDKNSPYKFTPEDTYIYTAGSKARDILKAKGFTIARDYSDDMEEIGYNDALKISKELFSDFGAGKINEIYIAYTFFKNTVVHIPRLMKLLPIDLEDIKIQDEETELLNQKVNFNLYQSEYTEKENLIMNYEPNDETILDLVVPKYLSAIIYGAQTASIASENGARMTAMDSATNNADELISELSIQYNRARQSAITSEITEIIAGANAV